MNRMNPPSQGPPTDTAITAAVTAQDEPALPLPPETDHPPVARGVAWTVAGFAAVQFFRFAFNLTLTQLVAPQVFGVMALVNLFVLALHMFSDLGIRQCVVHSPRGEDPRFLNTAWTLQVVRGLVLWTASGLIAWPLAWFYDQPELLWLIPITGFSAVLDGMDSTAIHTATRRLLRGRIVALELGSYVGSMGLVLFILYGLSRQGAAGQWLGTRQMMVFAMGNLAASVMRLVVSYRLIPGARNEIAWDSNAARELVRFGGWIFLSTACMFLASTADRMVVGKINVATLGRYHLATQLVQIPVLLMSAVGHQMAFPLFSRLLREGRPLRDVFPAVHAALAGFGGFLITGAAAVGPTLVRCLYDSRYVDPDANSAGVPQYIQWLIPAAWFAILQANCEIVLLALGHTRRVAVGQAVKLLCVPVFLGVGYQRYGIPGLIAGYTLAEVVRYALLAESLAQLGLPVFRYDSALSALIVVAGVGAIAVGGWVEGHASVYVRLFAETAVVLTVWGAAVTATWPTVGRPMIGVLRRNEPAGDPNRT